MGETAAAGGVFMGLGLRGVRGIAAAAAFGTTKIVNEKVNDKLIMGQGEFPTHLHGRIRLLAGAPYFPQTISCEQGLTYAEYSQAEPMTQVFLFLPDKCFPRPVLHFCFLVTWLKYSINQ